jgi:hypothetical protein
MPFSFRIFFIADEERGVGDDDLAFSIRHLPPTCSRSREDREFRESALPVAVVAAAPPDWRRR